MYNLIALSEFQQRRLSNKQSQKINRTQKMNFKEAHFYGTYLGKLAISTRMYINLQRR